MIKKWTKVKIKEKKFLINEGSNTGKYDFSGQILIVKEILKNRRIFKYILIDDNKNSTGYYWKEEEFYIIKEDKQLEFDF